MFYLAGTEFPTTTEQFVNAIIGGLRRVLDFPGGGPKIDVRGSFPAFESLEIDLTGGKIDPSRKVTHPVGTGHTSAGVTIASLKVIARPVHVAAGRITLDMNAKNARLDFDRDSVRGPILVASQVGSGHALVEIPHADLEAVALSKAKAMAAEQGAQVHSLTLSLTSRDPRSLAIEMKAGVKKFFVSGIVRFLGHLDISEQLVARLSNLDVKGEGLAMSMAEGLLRGKLKQVEGKEIELARFAVAGFKWHDVRIEPGPVIRVSATFGG